MGVSLNGESPSHYGFQYEVIVYSLGCCGVPPWLLHSAWGTPASLLMATTPRRGNWWWTKKLWPLELIEIVVVYNLCQLWVDLQVWPLDWPWLNHGICGKSHGKPPKSPGSFHLRLEPRQDAAPGHKISGTQPPSWRNQLPTSWPLGNQARLDGRSNHMGLNDMKWALKMGFKMF